jgi:hypothetical protein
LHIQHFLRPFTVNSGEMCSHAVMIHIDYIIHLYFLVYKFTRTHKHSQFSPQMVLVVLRILNTCVLDFLIVSVVWLVWVHGSFLWFLICRFIQVLFLSLVVNF